MKALKIALFGLAVTVGGVLGATTGSQDTGAAICCSRCWPNYNTCISGCGGDFECQALCEEKWYACDNYCNMGC